MARSHILIGFFSRTRVGLAGDDDPKVMCLTKHVIGTYSEHKKTSWLTVLLINIYLSLWKIKHIDDDTSLLGLPGLIEPEHIQWVQHFVIIIHHVAHRQDECVATVLWGIPFSKQAKHHETSWSSKLVGEAKLIHFHSPGWWTVGHMNQTLSGFLQKKKHVALLNFKHVLLCQLAKKHSQQQQQQQHRNNQQQLIRINVN